jgi:hypothetical protein
MDDFNFMLICFLGVIKKIARSIFMINENKGHKKAPVS